MRRLVCYCLAELTQGALALARSDWPDRTGYSAAVFQDFIASQTSDLVTTIDQMLIPDDIILSLFRFQMLCPTYLDGQFETRNVYVEVVRVLRH